MLPRVLEPFLESDLSTGAIVALVLGLACALGFEFVNGFHDTANAVATVIYTKTLAPMRAVALSGVCNFAGVFFGGIGVAMAIVHLLPVDVLVESGAHRGLAMVASLLLAAIAWNLATWWLGIPASSSHTMIGAILGVGIADSWLTGHPGEGVRWDKASEVLLSLVLSPVVGFALSAGLLWLAHRVIRDRRVFQAPDGDRAPPGAVRAVLVTTCAGVSFAHGMNDGQKGVGLVMLILVGVLPAGFAVDLEADAAEVQRARAASLQMIDVLAPLAADCPSWDASEAAPHGAEPICALSHHASVVRDALGEHSSVRELSTAARWRVREGVIRIEVELGGLPASVSAADRASLRAAHHTLRDLTDYAPTWVLVAVALALGIGTTVGWKRIVVTVGEKIGKTHLTYAQGASAELVAMVTIGASSLLGLPVSTTHVLSSGIAGTMVAEGGGVQPATVRKIALAWVLTLPVTMLLAGGLFAAIAPFFD